MELRPLPDRPADWDQRILRFDSKSLFHESAWLDFVLECEPRLTIRYYEIVRHERIVGYFCAILTRRAVLTLCESPFSGRGMHWGPIVNGDIDSAELAEAFLDLCRRERIAHFEVCHEPLSSAVMQKFGFTPALGVGHVCLLNGGVEAVWSRMRGTCRTRIRKAQKMGLTTEVTDDPAIADHFFRSYSDGLTRKGLKPSSGQGPEAPRLLLNHLAPTDRVFSIGVKYDGRIIGAGFYPHDERAMYFWDGASDSAFLHMSPNELLHWTAIQLAVARGIPVFKMSGGLMPQPPNRFIEKFGGESRQFTVYRKSLVPLLAPVRRAYRWLARSRPLRMDGMSAVLMGIGEMV
jgi:hypothetical protein